MKQERLILKFGTLKGWSCLSKTTAEILQKWADLGTSMSVMAQNDTPEQKEILCQAIDNLSDGFEIQNDWSGEKYTKEEAKKYIREYRA